ncbi:unnamed protein product, partial [Brenthis ino]
MGLLMCEVQQFKFAKIKDRPVLHLVSETVSDAMRCDGMMSLPHMIGCQSGVTDCPHAARAVPARLLRIDASVSVRKPIHETVLDIAIRHRKANSARRGRGGARVLRRAVNIV